MSQRLACACISSCAQNACATVCVACGCSAMHGKYALSCRFQSASALLLSEHGEPLNVLKLKQQELPQLGADDVKVKILAVSPCT